MLDLFFVHIFVHGRTVLLDSSLESQGVCLVLLSVHRLCACRLLLLFI
jgi:hypothetical protein